MPERSAALPVRRDTPTPSASFTEQRRRCTVTGVTEPRLVPEHLFPADRARAIVSCSPHGIVEADASTGTITWANPAMEAMFGRDPGGLVGIAIGEMHPPEALEAIGAAFARIASGDHRPVLAAPCLRADGTTFYCDIHPGEVTSTPSPRLIAFFSEVTDRHVFQQRLLSAEAMTHQGSWELDHHTGILFWSPEMHRLLGHDEHEQPPGVAWVLERVHPEDQEWVERAFETSLLTGQPYEVEHRMELDHGSVWVRATGDHLFGEDGTPLLSRGTLRDVTVERELLQRDRVSSMLTTLGSITGDLAAEIDNLLSVIANAIELLRDSIIDSPESDELLGLVNEACRRGHVLSRRLVGLSQQRMMRPADISVAEQLESIEPLLRTVTGSVARLHLDLPDAPTTAHADPDGLAAAVINLVANARDALIGSPGGHIRVSVTLVGVDDHLRRGDAPTDAPADLGAGPYVCVEVTDDGTGFDPAMLELALGSFWTTKTDGRGSGLGLPIVRDFAVRSGGGVTLRSTPGAGTTVSLWLPAGGTFS